MGGGLCLIAIDLLRLDSKLPQLIIQQHPGTGSPLPVDVPHALQIFNPLNILRISFLHHDPLDSPDSLNQRHLLSRKEAF